MKSNGTTTFMDTICRVVWKDKADRTKENCAYAYAVCDTILDPTVLDQRMSESNISPRLKPDYVPKGLESSAESENESDNYLATLAEIGDDDNQYDTYLAPIDDNDDDQLYTHYTHEMVYNIYCSC